MRSPHSILFLISLLLVSFTQKPISPKTTKPPIFQGICGVVLEKKGNHMPGPDKSASQGTPIEREVLIFPLLNMNQVKMGDNGFIDSVGNVKPIKTVKSDKSGKFCANLPVGHYSVVVRESKGLYANLSDAHNNIFPVNVRKNIRSEVKIEVTHQGVF